MLGVSYPLMKRLAVSNGVTWCLNQLFTSVARFHVFSERGPGSKSLLLVTFRGRERLPVLKFYEVGKKKSCVAL